MAVVVFICACPFVSFASLDYISRNVAANAEMAETRPEDFTKGILPPILNGTCAICSRSVISGILNVFCCAQTLNMSEIGRDVGISATIARQWISVLQASNQIVLLEPYYKSLGKRLVKSPKLYFTDTGLAAFLMGFQSADSLWNSTSAGALWENHVISRWQKRRDWHRPAASLWYWRDQGGNEVDLLIESDNRLTAIECKLAERPSGHDLRGLSRLEDFYGADVITHSFLACTTKQPFDLAPKITAVSGWTTWQLPSQ